MAENSSSDSVNETTADVMPADKIELSGGESPVSFDELEMVHRQHDQTKKEASNEVKAKAKAEALAKQKTSAPDEAEDEEEVDGEEADKETAGASKEKLSKDKASDKAEKITAKPIKAKFGDKVLDLDLQTLIPTKIDGKETEVSLDELRNNYAGKVKWSDKFSELGTKEQKLNKEREVVTTQLKEIFHLSQQDGIKALMKMAEFSGLDPMKWRQDFMKTLLPQLENFVGMSEDERNAAEVEFERNYYKQQAESQSKAQQDEASFKAFETKVRTLQQTHQVDDAKFEATYLELEKLQKIGELKRDITPEYVIEVIRSERVYDSLEDVFSELKLDLPEQEKTRIFQDMSEIADKNPDLSADDLKDIAREVWGKRKSQNLSRKLQKSGEMRKVAATKEAKNPGHEPLTFDDL